MPRALLAFVCSLLACRSRSAPSRPYPTALTLEFDGASWRVLDLPTPRDVQLERDPVRRRLTGYAPKLGQLRFFE